MRTARGLFDRVVSPDNLWLAYCDARRHKSRRPDVAYFTLHAETLLHELSAALREERWQPGGCKCLVIREPKRRLISAASFSDRVVHHAVHRHLAPVLLRRHMPDSFACIEGRGTHHAILAFQEGLRRHPWLIRLDVRRFFLEISWDHILNIVTRSVHDPPMMRLLNAILESGRGLYHDAELLEFLGLKDAYQPEPRKGLPIGNLTSQLFPNVYLDGVDHLIKRNLKIPTYVRYMDDLVLFGPKASTLSIWAKQVRDWLLSERNLPTRMPGEGPQRTSGHHRFLGYTVSREQRRVSRDTLRRLRGRLKTTIRADDLNIDPDAIETRLHAIVKGLIF